MQGNFRLSHTGAHTPPFVEQLSQQELEQPSLRLSYKLRFRGGSAVCRPNGEYSSSSSRVRCTKKKGSGSFHLLPDRSLGQLERALTNLPIISPQHSPRIRDGWLGGCTYRLRPLGALPSPLVLTFILRDRAISHTPSSRPQPFYYLFSSSLIHLRTT
ncbi:hypothetical protein ASPBRDRAFT_232856 [Aspergillus brasiliensis CBS 101740]|uniref:Uncharacterized protein n=1 Tax=Aspergillus brasiliensis (strain CBS 101740 / IMI 381727 / IBT 21946) TaxID=767769 RepID=A0A1L9V001_ASPBC|nr:hypothetical protein ASPBRDRAFT_232856 [Aspergillus brasiliensis CBS 101740]